MQRQALLSLAAALTFSSAGAFAQSGDLSGVTMRVLDDLADVDAVVLSLDANRGDGDAQVEGEDRPAAAEADETAERARERTLRDEVAEAERRAERREDKALHEADDERAEGRLEDRDVERPAVAAPAVP